MDVIQASFLFGTSAIVVIALYYHIMQFKTTKKLFAPIFIILLVFTIGFALRLSEAKQMVDTGYFLTEISDLATNLLFTVALILGQKKYWKI